MPPSVLLVKVRLPILQTSLTTVEFPRCLNLIGFYRYTCFCTTFRTRPSATLFHNGEVQYINTAISCVVSIKSYCDWTLIFWYNVITKYTKNWLQLNSNPIIWLPIVIVWLPRSRTTRHTAVNPGWTHSTILSSVNLILASYLDMFHCRSSVLSRRL